MTDYIPLLSPKPFSEYSPEEFKQYVESLYVAPPERKPPAEWSVSLNKQGNPVLRISRKPKYLTAQEVSTAAEEIGWPLQKFWVNCLKKKIEIRVPRIERKR